MTRFSFNRHRLATGALALTLLACHSKGPVEAESEADTGVAASAESQKAPEEIPQKKPSKAPTLRVPVVPVDLDAAPASENTLELTGTVAIYNDGDPADWTCPEKDCSLDKIVEALEIQKKDALRIAVSPEVDARSLTYWVRALQGEGQRIYLTQGPNSEFGVLSILPGRIYPFVASPASWKHTIRKPLKDEKAESENAQNAPKVSVRGGAMTVNEDCNDPTLKRKTRRHIRHFVACYRSYSEAPNPKEGTVTLVWGVAPSGAVQEGTVASESLEDDTLFGCLKEALGTIGYTPFDERGAACEISWDLRFKQRHAKEVAKAEDSKKDSLTNGHVTAIVAEKTVSLSPSPSAATKIVSLDKVEDLRAEIRELLKGGRTAAMVTYGRNVNAQSIYRVSALLTEAGVTDLRLAHPRR